MRTLLDILDFVVLLLLVIHAARRVRGEQPQDRGSLVLSIFVALALIVFAYVSLTAYVGLVGDSSLPTQVIFLVILLLMAAVIRSSWANRPT